MNETHEKYQNDLFKVINNRRSIRKFTDKEIDSDIIKKILKAGFRAPFAYQSCSIVYTKDKEKMKKLRQMGIYPTTNLFMVFFIDFNRMEKILKQRGYSYDFDDSLLLWLGVQDVAAVSQNVTLAADALGLGSVLLGGAPLKVEQIIEVFNLPPKVFPVVGLCLGYPDPDHLMDIRPRYPLKYSAFEDQYKDYTNEEIAECMKAMDEGYITQGYYIKLGAKIPLKKKEDTIGMDKYSWSEHISRKISQGMRLDKTLLDILRKQGFDLK
jgi:nitroreductase